MAGFHNPLSVLRRGAPALVERAANDVSPLLRALLIDPNVQLASDAYWSATHPVDRLMGRGRAANGQMVVPWVAGRPWYHGSSRVFDRFNPKLADEEALYGPGHYVTDSPHVASSYTEKGSGHLMGSQLIPRVKPLSRDPAWQEFFAMNPDMRPSLLHKLTTGHRLKEQVARKRAEYEKQGYHVDNLRRTEGGVQFDFHHREVGPNVTRYSFTPDKVYDVREGVTNRDANKLVHAIVKHLKIPETRAWKARDDVKAAARVGGSKDVLWQALARNIGARRANEVIRDAGYDAIAYPGGHAMGGTKHEALVVLNRRRLYKGGRPQRERDVGASHLYTRARNYRGSEKSAAIGSGPD
jgi:hypothetical protein